MKKWILMALGLLGCQQPLLHQNQTAKLHILESAPLERQYLQKALEQAQHWNPQSYLTGIYLYRIQGRQLLKYEFQMSEHPEQLMLTLRNDHLEESFSDRKFASPPLEHWQVDADAALRRARSHGFELEDYFGLGLGNWSGLGIPHKGAKWSVLPFIDTPAGVYYVIDALNQGDWVCQPSAQPDQGCKSLE